MIAPVALTVAYVKYRRIIQRSDHLPDVRWLYRTAAGLLIIANAALVRYSWIVVIPVALWVAILLDGLIKKSAKRAA